MAGRDRTFVGVQHQTRRRNAQDLELAAHGVGRLRQQAGGLVIDLCVRVLATEGDGAGDDARRDEAGQVVDVAVGVVVQQAVAQPDHHLGADRGGQSGLGVGLAPVLVAVPVQQALARSQDRAFAVVIQGAAFEDEGMAGRWHARELGDLVGDLVVVRIVVLAAPAVEAKGLSRLRAGVEDRAGVTQPDVAETTRHDLDAVHAFQTRARAGQGLIIADHQLDLLAARTGQRSHQGLDLILGLREVVAPQLGMAGPADPHRTMRRPFGGDRLGHERSRSEWEKGRPRQIGRDAPRFNVCGPYAAAAAQKASSSADAR
ncbi:hypothetical protein D3C85_575600 [compost metagenome]